MVTVEMKRMIDLDQIKVVLEMLRIEILNLKADVEKIKEETFHERS